MPEHGDEASAEFGRRVPDKIAVQLQEDYTCSKRNALVAIDKRVSLSDPDDKQKGLPRKVGIFIKLMQ